MFSHDWTALLDKARSSFTFVRGTVASCAGKQPKKRLTQHSW
jgi:hypothetical protein